MLGRGVRRAVSLVSLSELLDIPTGDSEVASGATKASRPAATETAGKEGGGERGGARCAKPPPSSLRRLAAKEWDWQPARLAAQFVDSRRRGTGTWSVLLTEDSEARPGAFRSGPLPHSSSEEEEPLPSGGPLQKLPPELLAMVFQALKPCDFQHIARLAPLCRAFRRAALEMRPAFLPRTLADGHVLEPCSGLFFISVAPGQDVRRAIERCPEGGSLLLLPGHHTLALAADAPAFRRLSVFGRGAATLRLSGPGAAHQLLAAVMLDRVRVVGRQRYRAVGVMLALMAVITVAGR